jgi:hypothetical protein
MSGDSILVGVGGYIRWVVAGPDLRSGDLRVMWDEDPRRVVFEQGECLVALSSAQLDAVVHWAMGNGMLPALMDEIRAMIRKPEGR